MTNNTGNLFSIFVDVRAFEKMIYKMGKYRKMRKIIRTILIKLKLKKMNKIKRTQIENGDIESIRVAIENGADINQIDDGNSALNVCAEVYSVYENNIGRNQNIDRNIFNNWRKNVLEIADMFIYIIKEKKLDINLVELAQKSPKIFSIYIKSMNYEEQKNIISNLKTDIIFRVFEELGYFPLIELIEKEKAKEVLYKMSIQQRGPIIQKMKDPPDVWIK